uniref:NAC1 n=1 Tax=Arundo donax TaxID=35708 RepID=A0A0A9RU74_ARUDO
MMGTGGRRPAARAQR